MVKVIKDRRKISVKRKIFVGIIIVILILLLAFFVYTKVGYYKADDTVNKYLQSGSGVKVTYIDEDYIVFEGQEIKAGFILYPGAKVDYTAYAPMMNKLAEKGILCIIVRMPHNIAFLNMNAALKICEEYTEVTDWYIGGHSLGGVAASECVYKHKNSFKGLILLASFSTKDISTYNIRALVIRASEDEVLDEKEYDSYENKLPKDTQEIMIQGGCHTGFGYYGPQKGDGKPSISSEKQIDETVSLIMDFINAEK